MYMSGQSNEENVKRIDAVLCLLLRGDNDHLHGPQIANSGLVSRCDSNRNDATVCWQVPSTHASGFQYMNDQFDLIHFPTNLKSSSTSTSTSQNPPESSSINSSSHGPVHRNRRHYRGFTYSLCSYCLQAGQGGVVETVYARRRR